jgi:hypothetical protein
LCPIPGICATTCFELFKNTLTAGLLAELGFLGVTILGLKTFPPACGHFSKAALLCLFGFLTKLK